MSKKYNSKRNFPANDVGTDPVQRKHGGTPKTSLGGGGTKSSSAKDAKSAASGKSGEWTPARPSLLGCLFRQPCYFKVSSSPGLWCGRRVRPAGSVGRLMSSCSEPWTG